MPNVPESKTVAAVRELFARNNLESRYLSTDVIQKALNSNSNNPQNALAAILQNSSDYFIPPAGYLSNKAPDWATKAPYVPQDNKASVPGRGGVNADVHVGAADFSGTTTAKPHLPATPTVQSKKPMIEVESPAVHVYSPELRAKVYEYLKNPTDSNQKASQIISSYSAGNFDHALDQNGGNPYKAAQAILKNEPTLMASMPKATPVYTAKLTLKVEPKEFVAPPQKTIENPEISFDGLALPDDQRMVAENLKLPDSFQPKPSETLDGYLTKMDAEMLEAGPSGMSIPSMASSSFMHPKPSKPVFDSEKWNRLPPATRVISLFAAAGAGAVVGKGVLDIVNGHVLRGMLEAVPSALTFMGTLSGIGMSTKLTAGLTFGIVGGTIAYALAKRKQEAKISFEIRTVSDALGSSAALKLMGAAATGAALAYGASTLTHSDETPEVQQFAVEAPAFNYSGSGVNAVATVAAPSSTPSVGGVPVTMSYRANEPGQYQADASVDAQYLPLLSSEGEADKTTVREARSSIHLAQAADQSYRRGNTGLASRLVAEMGASNKEAAK